MATSERRVGLFGGTFDPPHIGHVIVAVEALWQLGLDEVRLMPVGTPVHRDPPVEDGPTRMRLVERAIQGHRGLAVESIEVRQPGLDYTVDTLRALGDREPEVEWTLIVGADQVDAFDTWRDPVRIVQMARLGVVARGDADAEAVLRAASGHAPGRSSVVQIPRIDVSASDIRARRGAGQPIAHLVPMPVWEMIDGEGLYRSGK